MKTYTLPNGLRIILAPSATDVVYAGIAVAAGTRHELDNESGMAHFVEHMSFKGTERLSSVQILNRMESVGGDLNAYTGKEETIYYATFLRQHLKRALPLLMDIVFSSIYPQEELEKEREVVIDEIESYEDSPAELIYDDFESLLFPNHPLGRRILGDADSLRRYTPSDLHTFVKRCYSPEKAVLFIKGNIDPSLMASLLALPIKDCTEQTSVYQSFMETVPSRIGRINGESIAGEPVYLNKNTHQAHVMLGTRAFAFTDPRHTGLALLSNLLGGPAMNSRLSLALRERTGLVYTVESSVTTYTDTGVWAVYFGCDHDDVRRCLRLVHRELRRLIDAPLSSRALAMAKRQLKGQLGVSSDNFENVALSMAKRYLHTGRVKSLDELYADIDELTADELQSIAAEVFNPDRLTTLIYN